MACMVKVVCENVQVKQACVVLQLAKYARVFIGFLARKDFRPVSSALK